MEKRAVSILFISILLLSINLVLAVNLDIDVKPISNSVIADLDEPAVFDLIIENLGETESFEIYSLVGIDIFPETEFIIESERTKIIRIEVMPQDSISSKPGFLTFAYLIRGKDSGVQEETLTINILKLEDVFSITPQSINPQSESIIISIKNRAQLDFTDLKIKINSAFFDYYDTISLNSLEKKEIEIPLDKEKLKILDAGQFVLNTQIEVKEKIADVDSIIKFLEQEDIETKEIKEGLIIKRYEITKSNLGNIRKIVEITAEKDFFSYLFTTINIAPTKTEIRGFKKHYIWEKELIPNEELKIIIKTNWLYPIFIILVVIGLFILIKRSIERDLSLKKHVSFVKTKGGQFALKITLKLKSKKFIERINIIDKLPPLVKIYEKFGSITPDKVDSKNRRIEWNVETLNEGEERIFTYIIYSKIGVVGKFELPSAKVVYEKEGQIKETISNRSFFINEPKR